MFLLIKKVTNNFILFYIDYGEHLTLSPKQLKSEENYVKSIGNNYRKINFSKNLFNQKNRKEKQKQLYKNKLASLNIENCFIYKRINDATSIYSHKNFQKDFELSQIYKTNICKLPKINFKNYIKPLKLKETPKKIYKINYDNFSTVNTNLTTSSKNKYENLYDDLDDIDSISLYFYLTPNLKDHPYIIISSPNEFFSEVIKKLCDTATFIKKDNIIAYKYENDNKIELEMFKTLKENGLKNKSKIIIKFE